MRLYSADRGFNWYAARWGMLENYNPTISPYKAGYIRLLVTMDQKMGFFTDCFFD